MNQLSIEILIEDEFASLIIDGINCFEIKLDRFSGSMNLNGVEPNSFYGLLATSLQDKIHEIYRARKLAGDDRDCELSAKWASKVFMELG